MVNHSLPPTETKKVAGLIRPPRPKRLPAGAPPLTCWRVRSRSLAASLICTGGESASLTRHRLSRCLSGVATRRPPLKEADGNTTANKVPRGNGGRSGIEAHNGGCRNGHARGRAIIRRWHVGDRVRVRWQFTGGWLTGEVIQAG